jgi:hypothetical protein
VSLRNRLTLLVLAHVVVFAAACAAARIAGTAILRRKFPA